MSRIAETMYVFFQNSKTEGAYILLFALSIVILYSVGKDRFKFNLVYPLLLMLGVACNPVTIWTLSLIFPVIKHYSMIPMLIPIFVYIPYAITELLYKTKTVKTRRIVAVLLFIYVSICGNFLGAFPGNTRTDINHYDEGKKQIVEYLDVNKPNLVLADDDILPFISSYGDMIPLLYGHNIMQPDSDLGVKDSYDERIFYIHDLMWKYDVYMDEITSVAASMGCDIIIIKNYEGAEDREGTFKRVLTTDDYIVYRSVI